jgi:thiamine biosynthesis lipoprotein
MRWPILLVLACWLALGAAEDAWYRGEKLLYAGIPVAVRFTPADPALAERVWAYLDSVDQGFNDWRDNSDIGRINAGGPGDYPLTADLAAAFELCGRMQAATDGAFEPTLGALRRLWRAAEKSGRWPDDAALVAARAATGPATYRCDGRSLRVLAPGVKFDFGGVVKGMAVDRATALLRAAGCTAGLVQVGGETGCWGISPRGAPHRIGIPHPEAPDDLDRLWCRLCGSTSGNYRNPVRIGERTCYHIYDPRSGQPIDTHVLSVSVVFAGVGRNGEADALTKAGGVLGVAGLPLIERAGAQALLLLKRGDGTIEQHTTAGWARLVVAPPEGGGK